MVHFFMKKYIQTVKARSSLLLYAFVPVLAYLFYAASQPDHFKIHQDISITAGAPIALSNSPTETAPISDYVTKPDDFFQNSFVLSELFQLLNPGTARDIAKNQLPVLANEIKNCLTMTLPAENTVRISFSGKDSIAGEKMVVYFTGRLVRKALEGRRRSSMQTAGTPSPSDQYPAVLNEPLRVKGERAIFRANRLIPSLLIFGFTFIIILIWLAVQEGLDPSFKSERQATRYLELNSLGTLPDLGELSKTIGTRTKS